MKNISINKENDKDNKYKVENSQNLFLTFEQSSLLHKKEEPYFYIICEVCNRRFKSKDALFAHIKDKRHFQCNVCGKIFLSKIAIESHSKAKSHF